MTIATIARLERPILSSILAGVVLLGGSAALAEEQGTAPPSLRVHAFYYPWYANPAADGRWGHWNHQILLREGNGGYHDPPANIGANFYPQLGCYSSSSAADLAVHMRQLRSARVGVISVSWWGRGSAEDAVMPKVLDAAAAQGIRVSFHIEPYGGRGPVTLKQDIDHIVKRYGPSPAFYRHGGGAVRPGKPLLYVYDSYLTPAAEWAKVLAPGGEGSIRGTSLDAVVIALYVKEGDEQFVTRGGFDGCYTYFATDGFTHGSTPRNWPRIAEWARREGKIFIPSVGPGYDDTRVRPWNGRNRRDRKNGAYYDATFQAALDVFPPAISITSFNEWHEGTQIEPAVPRSIEGYAYTDYSPREPDHYLNQTREWVEMYEGGFIMTVQGSAAASRLGKALVHEHILCDFRGARVSDRAPPDPRDVMDLMLPRVKDLSPRGFTAFFDCTPAFIGRDARILSRLGEETGMRFITNTGYYGAAGDKFLPEHAFSESAEALADRWTAEWREGIDGTGIRPGFIKIGVDPGPLSPVDRKLAQAAARAHLRTGLTIACHTGEGAAALDVLKTIEEEGAAPSALVVVHADGIEDRAVHKRLAEAGAWVEYDGVGGRPSDAHVAMILEMVSAGHAGRLLLSHDAGWYQAGEPDGGASRVRPFTSISDQLLPALQKAGLGRDVARRLLEENPAGAFVVRVRRRE